MIDEILGKKIIELFFLTFPAGAKKGRLEIYCGDGYAEYPMKYFNASGGIVEKKVNGFDSPKMLVVKDLIKLLNKVLDHREGLSKKSLNYWNHLFFVVDSDLNYDYKFSYQPELDIQEENEIRASIGDELYEKYEQERKEKAIAFAIEDALEKETPTNIKKDETPMTFKELMCFLQEVIIHDIPKNWERIEIGSKLDIDTEGRQKIDGINHYFLKGEEDSHQFTTNNMIGLMNAISKIEKLMSTEGKGWKRGDFTFYSDGRASLKTDDEIWLHYNPLSTF